MIRSAYFPEADARRSDKYRSIIYNLPNLLLSYNKKELPPYEDNSFILGRERFELSKASPTDLQSAPFGHSGIRPYQKYLIKMGPTGLEPVTLCL